MIGLDDRIPRHVSLQSIATDIDYGSMAATTSGKDGIINVQRKHAVLFDPRNAYRRVWDCVIIICVLYNTIVMPVRTCFYITERSYSNILKIFLDICYFFDIIINFETGIIMDNPDKIWKKKTEWRRFEVRRLYLSSWFPIDFIACVPLFVEIVCLCMAVNSETSILQSALRILRLTRVLKVIHIWEYYGWSEAEKQIGFDYIELIKFVSVMFYFLHWSACAFYAIDANLCPQNINRSTFWANDMNSLPWEDQYVASLYWSMATVLTVGYGDISSQCTATRIYAIFIMLMGSVMYAYGLSMIFGIMQKRHDHDRELKLLLSLSDAEYTHLPVEVSDKVKEYLVIHKKIKRKQELLNELKDDELQAEVKLHVFIAGVSVLRPISRIKELSAFKQILISRMKIMNYLPGKPIVDEGTMSLSDKNSHSIFYIAEGRVKEFKWLTGNDKVHGSGGLQLRTLRDGDSFGEFCFLSNLNNQSRTGIETVNQAVGDLKYISKAINSGDYSQNTVEAVTYNSYQPYTIKAVSYTEIWQISWRDFEDSLQTLGRELGDIMKKLREQWDIILEETSRLEEKYIQQYPDIIRKYLSDFDNKISDEVLLDKSPLSYAIQYLRDVRNSLSPPPNETIKAWTSPRQFFENLVEINLIKSVTSLDATEPNEGNGSDSRANSNHGRDTFDPADSAF